MERQRIMIVVLIAAIALGGVASYSIYNYLQSQQQEVDRAKSELGAIVVAAEPIPFGARIEEKHLKKVIWPKANIPSGTFTDPAPLIGRTVVSSVVAGEPLMEAKLAPTEAKGGFMAYLIPEGHRAMAVAVNEVVGVGGFVLPNSTVDVVVTTTPPGGTQMSKIVLQNLKVLAVGQKMEEKEGKAIIVPTVTVSITPDEAEKLALASNSGPLQLLLRGTTDDVATSTKGANLSNLIAGGVPAAVVAKAEKMEAKPAAKKKVVKHVKKAPAPAPAETIVKPAVKETVTIDVIKANRSEIKRSQDVLTEDEEGFWKKEVTK